jgi:hypothetical protein
MGTSCASEVWVGYSRAGAYLLDSLADLVRAEALPIRGTHVVPKILPLSAGLVMIWDEAWQCTWVHSSEQQPQQKGWCSCGWSGTVKVEERDIRVSAYL